MAKKRKRSKARKYSYPHPENGRKVSRQRIFALRRREKGLCVRCGSRSKSYRCGKCQELHLEAQRKAA